VDMWTSGKVPFAQKRKFPVRDMRASPAGRLFCRLPAVCPRGPFRCDRLNARCDGVSGSQSQIIDPGLLLLAYRSGIFPMADARDDPEIYWVEPRLRGILPLDGFHCSHSLARTLRRGRFEVTCDTAFAQVLAACAAPRPGLEPDDPDDPDDETAGTWISERIEATYLALHARGQAHSVECWQTGADGARALVGGLYGVGFDRVFCGESMFSRVPDASKVALAWLVAALRLGGVELLDCQFMTGHLASMGAVEISQSDYLGRLHRAQRNEQDDQSGCAGAGAGAASGAGASAGAGAALSLPEAFGALLATAKSCGLSSSPGKLIAQSFTHTS